SAPIASAPTTASNRNGARSAGHTCAATSPSTPTSFADVPGVEPTNNAAERGPPRRRHLPQALIRQALARRRAHHRTTALGRPDLQAATPLALRLPRRRPRRQVARPPRPPPPLTRFNE